MDNNKLTAPIAAKKPVKLTVHNDDRIDDYYWLRERENQEVIDYLNAENDYLDQEMGHLKNFRESLFQELKGRIKEDDASVPYLENGFYYYTRQEEGKEYNIYCRKESLDAEEEILLNENEMAKPHAYYEIGDFDVSPNNKIVAYSEDTVSRRIYTLKFKNLETGELLQDEIPNTSGSCVWANDNTTVFYSQKDEALRPYRIFKHKLGTPVSEDVMVYEEKDDTFRCGIYKSKSGAYLVIASVQTVSNEYRFVSADTPDAEFTMFTPRQRNLEYEIGHHGDYFYIRTNYEAKNFRLMKTPVGNTGLENWTEVVAHRDDVFLEGIDLFNDYIVLSERIDGLSQINILNHKGESHYVPFDEEVFMCYTFNNLVFDTNTLRLGYQSMTTPPSVLDYNMESRTFTLLKEHEVLGGFDKHNYQTERVWVEARDGVKVPMSIVYRKGFEKNASHPTLLYGYGSYGYSMEPYFSSVRLSLLDRGFVYAIAHIRGGEELGRQWYEDGKMFNKINTFTDFIDCGQYLVKQQYASPDALFAMGGSAGGLLVGAAMNMAPDLWTGIVAAVPFVDVVTTMLDDTIPLTTGEYDEWGNPGEKEAYLYMKSYSPYDNVAQEAYPHLLITTGLHDSQVQYWEPAKWTAKLRDMKTNDNKLLLYTNMDTGHGGASGRFERLKEIALEYAFILDLANRVDE